MTEKVESETHQLVKQAKETALPSLPGTATHEVISRNGFDRGAQSEVNVSR